MLFALSPPSDARLMAVASAVEDLRAKARRLQQVPPPAVKEGSLSFSESEYEGDNRLLLVDGDPSLSHTIWTAANKAGFDCRGGDPPALGSSQ